MVGSLSYFTLHCECLLTSSRDSERDRRVSWCAVVQPSSKKLVEPGERRPRSRDTPRTSGKGYLQDPKRGGVTGNRQSATPPCLASASASTGASITIVAPTATGSRSGFIS